MFKQTTCISFEEYGDVLSYLSNYDVCFEHKKSIVLAERSIDKLFYAQDEIFIKLKKGVILILVSKDGLFENIESYILNGRVKLNKGIYYNFIPISDDCMLNIYSNSISNESLQLDYSYTYNEIIPTINIDKIYTRFYQDKPTNYLFKGEKHAFWELTFVDRGVLYTKIDGIEYKLKQNDIIFYAPNQYHSQYTDDKKSCSYLTMSFDMNFTNFELLSNKVFSCSKDINTIVDNLIKELNSNNIYSYELALCYLKQIIIKVLTLDFDNIVIKPLNTVQQHFDNELLDTILEFIHNNISLNIDVQTLCDKFSISSSKLHLLFKSNLNTTATAYISNIKLNKSKDLLKESNHTISQISEILGFTSVHYFSKKFKKNYGFSPSEYLRSVNKNTQ